MRLNDRPSMNFINTAIRMRRTATVDMEVTSDPIMEGTDLHAIPPVYDLQASCKLLKQYLCFKHQTAAQVLHSKGQFSEMLLYCSNLADLTQGSMGSISCHTSSASAFGACTSCQHTT